MHRSVTPFTITSRSTQETAALAEFYQHLSPQMKLVGPDGATLELPASTYEILKQGAKVLSSGHTLYQDALDRQLSTQEAAQLLDISRTFLLKLLEKNEIPFTLVGSHRRLQLSNILDYKKRQGIRTKIGTTKKNNLQLQALIERSRAITFITSFHETLEIHYISPQIQYLLGYKPEEFRKDPTLYRKITVPSDWQSLRKSLQQKGTTDIPFELDVRLKASDGSVRWVRCEGFAIHEGECRVFEGILIDITDRKIAEEALKRNNMQYRRILDYSADGISLINENGLIVEWNKALEEITGLPRSTTIERSLSDIIFRLYPDHKKSDQANNAIEQALKRILASTTPSNKLMEVLIQRPNGEIRHIETQYFPIKTEDGCMACAISRDITERKNSETTALTTHERYRSTLDQIPGMVWLSGLDGKCQYVNQPWLDHTGRTLEEEIGDAWLDNIHPEDLNQVLAGYLKAFHFQENQELDYRLRRFDGHYQMLHAAGKPFLDSDGNFAGYIILCREGE